jgi:lysozyme
MNSVIGEGIALIKKFEQLRLTPYADTGGISTVGYGHRIYPGEFKPSDFPLTEAQADTLLDKDIALKSTWVEHYVKVPLNDNQFSALVSLVFNEGVTPLCDTLGNLLNKGDYQGATDQFGRWIYGKVDGVETVLTDLVERRAAERELFLEPIEETLPWQTTTSK